ncbi:MAG: glycogen synthase GlgA [Alphaproteobacteria bacterium]
MQVLFVASECAPLVKTGGLADVVSALPKALAAQGVAARVMLPGYPAATAALAGGRETDAGFVSAGGPVRLVAGSAAGLDLIAVDAPHLFDRPGSPYLGPDGRDWTDNHLRYGALCRAAAAVARDGLDGWRPELVHVHDWQAGLVPAYLKLTAGAAPPVVATIHNIAFQGLFPAGVLDALELPWAGFTAEGFEFYGHVGFLKAGLAYADRITTVSPTYARELMTADFGLGLEGLVAARRADVAGILNGVDLEVWDPETDAQIAAPYSIRRLRPKAVNRAAVERRLALDPDPSRPLFCVISRLTRQKGLDLLLDCMPRLLARGARLAVLGAGDADLEAGFRAAAAANPGRIAAVIGYDEPLSHLLQAGADAIVIPSRFEPCGLTQLYGLRYGTLPVVARTGGLADTVIDANEAALADGVATGFQFAPVTAPALADAIDRACDLFADAPRWTAAVRRAMRQDVGWSVSAARYAALYRELVGR